MRRIGGRLKGERGQVLILFAAALAGLCGFVGMAVDVGNIVYTRTDLQKAADAAAFAGAQDLPGREAATSSANYYVYRNGARGTTATITFERTYSDNDTITVTTKRTVNFTFLKALGMSGTDVTATAKARGGYYSGGAGLLPWGFIASNNDNSTLLQNGCYLSNDASGMPKFKQGVECTIKYGAGGGGDRTRDIRVATSERLRSGVPGGASTRKTSLRAQRRYI